MNFAVPRVAAGKFTSDSAPPPPFGRPIPFTSRRYSHYKSHSNEIQLGSGMDTGVPGRVSGCDHCKL